MNDEHRPRDVETEQPVAEPPLKFISGADLVNALTLLVCALAAWCLPRAAWGGAARQLASLHVRLRGVPADRTRGIAQRLGTTAAALQRQIIENVYLDNIEVLREHHPIRSPINVHLEGGERLSAAHAEGRGVILWVTAFTHADLMTKKGLAGQGFRATHLSTVAHGYSASWFGIRFLNNIRVRAENRYLGRRVNVTYGQARAAMQLLAESLAKGDVVTITALGAGRRVVTVPFAGGDIHLAVGAPQLALGTGVPLLPVFTTPDGRGGYTIHVGEALKPSPGDDKAASLERMVQGYVNQLAPHVERNAPLWRGWTNAGLWTPRPAEADRATPNRGAAPDA